MTSGIQVLSVHVLEVSQVLEVVRGRLLMKIHVSWAIKTVTSSCVQQKSEQER